jgi:HNH endonuclease
MYFFLKNMDSFNPLTELENEAFLLFGSEYPDFNDERPLSRFKHSNYFGFVVGILRFIDSACGEELVKLRKEIIDTLNSKDISVKYKRDLIKASSKSIYSIIICSFLRYSASPNTTPSDSRSSTPSPSNPREKSFKEALHERDVICCVCWKSEKLLLNGAHIIAHKTGNVMAIDTERIARICGIGLNSLQNGLLLCSDCHSHFDALKLWFDVEEDRNNQTIYRACGRERIIMVKPDWRVTNTKHSFQKEIVQGQLDRCGTTIEEETEDGLFSCFPSNEASYWPNAQTLAFHKKAGLIWKFSAGSGEFEEYDYDNTPEDGIVVVQKAIKKLERFAEESEAYF